MDRIEKRLVRDLQNEYPDLELSDTDAIWDILMDIYTANPELRIIFVLDEWDFIFHQEFVTEEDKKDYLLFLRNLLKDRPYISLAYMTGILPIAKYSSGSELNMFAEFTMTNEKRFSEYFGFTDEEVDRLYQRYVERTEILAFIRGEYKGMFVIYLKNRLLQKEGDCYQFRYYSKQSFCVKA